MAAKKKPENPNPGWTCEDVDQNMLIVFVLGTFAVWIISFFLLGWLHNNYKVEDEALAADVPAISRGVGSYQGADRLQPDPPVEIVALNAAQEGVLHSYGWANAAENKVRVPIEVAMARKLEQGIKSGKVEAKVFTEEELKGKEIYMGLGACFTCHGNTGRGDGAAAAAMDPKPLSFAAGEFRYDTDKDGVKGGGQDLADIIQKGALPYGGSPLMMGRADITGENLENLIKYIKALKQD